MIGTDLHFEGCSGNDMEDRFGEGGNVGMREMMVSA